MSISSVDILSEVKEQITKRLSELLKDPEETIPTNLFSAARYAVFPTGKLLRPLLVCISGKALGAPLEALVTPACAIELVHTYSLIHDDLPCMDNDDIRRGRPTLHKAFPESHALLVGDFLLTYAFEVIANAPLIDDAKKAALVRALAQAAGPLGMVGGQSLDMSFTGHKIDWTTLQQIHLGKTAALLQASVCFGGIIASIPPEEMDVLALFGKYLGLAFQITDDILDVTGSVQTLGKPVGSDQKKSKLNAVAILGLAEANSTAKDFFHMAISLLSKLPYPTGHLEDIANSLIERKC